MDVQMTEECKVVLLNLTSRYAQTWSHWEGIREFIQNWHDGIYDASDKHIRRHYTGFGESQKVNFIKRRDDTEEVVYEAMVAINGGTENYGSLHYDKFNKRLTLINRGISLQKKILLLGFSSHSHTRNENVIGQFGEGLKIGALALVRQGRYVTMETNKERWQFAMHPYEHYGGEQGLVVLVTKSERIHFEDKEELDFIFPPCPVELQEEDTSCSISSISLEEFEECRQRFLFLTPPTEQVKTEIGTLLLDDIFAGMLFVKGSFVVDLRDNSLITGVNFFDLKIDRDRNAVPQLSEIDHKVSCMWPRALVSRRDLAERYYNLLVDHAECRDVKHAKTYANTDESVAPKLMVEEFRKRTPENSFPIPDSIAPHQVPSIHQELGQPIVQVNEILLSILHKSGEYITLDEARERLRPDKSTLRPTSSLTEDQNSVLRQAIIMVNQVDPHLRPGMILVIDTKNEEKPAIRDDKIEIPVWMVKQDVVHKYGKLCKTTNLNVGVDRFASVMLFLP
ncbi:uncharacterized protein [Ptychodera flava]|uniref:uncharacterized protein n=1 Tax=Ptychodera flava TaxID=63121 RepID=UPI00396A07E7